MDDGTFGDNEILVTSSVSVWLVFDLLSTAATHHLLSEDKREKKKARKNLHTFDLQRRLAPRKQSPPIMVR